MTILRQSTQVIVPIGPFMDVSNGVTPETGVSLSSADQAEVLKVGGAATVDISSATWSAITGSGGWYHLTLTTSHTDTVGPLKVVVQDESLCFPVFSNFQVIEEAVYDAMFAANATGPLSLSTAGALAFKRAAESMFSFTVDTGASTTNIPLSSLSPASAVDNQFAPRAIFFASDTTTAALRGVARKVLAFDHSGQAITVDALPATPASGDVGVIG